MVFTGKKSAKPPLVRQAVRFKRRETAPKQPFAHDKSFHRPVAQRLWELDEEDHKELFIYGSDTIEQIRRLRKPFLCPCKLRLGSAPAGVYAEGVLPENHSKVYELLSCFLLNSSPSASMMNKQSQRGEKMTSSGCWLQRTNHSHARRSRHWLACPRHLGRCRQAAPHFEVGGRRALLRLLCY